MSKELEKIVLEFRKGLLARRTSGGRCWHLCYPLEGYLRLLGHEVAVTEGCVKQGKEWIAHYWLTRKDGSIIDPTSDQFKDGNGERMPKVYIGNKPSWYGSISRLFKP